MAAVYNDSPSSTSEPPPALPLTVSMSVPNGTPSNGSTAATDSHHGHAVHPAVLDPRLPTDMRRCWYPLSIAKDLRPNDVVGLHLLGDPVCLYRSRSGRPVCLADRCAHRGCPLSCGQVVDGRLECRCDGWLYDARGHVCFIPTLLPDRSIPDNAYTYSYATEELYGMIWVWAGPRELANSSLIPNITPGAELPEDFTKPFRVAVDLDIDHAVMIEQFLDTSRLTYLGYESYSQIYNNASTKDDTTSFYSTESQLDLRSRLKDSRNTRPLRMDASVVDIAGWANSFDEEPRWVVRGELKDPRQKKFERQIIYFVPPCHILLRFEFKQSGRSLTGNELSTSESAQRSSGRRLSTSLWPWRYSDAPSIQQTIHCVPTRKGHMRLIFSQARSYYVWIDRLIPFRDEMLSAMTLNFIFKDYDQLRGQEVRLLQGYPPFGASIQVDTLPNMYRLWLRHAMGSHRHTWFRGWQSHHRMFGTDTSAKHSDHDHNHHSDNYNGTHQHDHDDASGLDASVMDKHVPLDQLDDQWSIPNQRGVDNSAYTWRRDLALGRGVSQSQPSYWGRYTIALGLIVGVVYAGKRYGF